MNAADRASLIVYTHPERPKLCECIEALVVFAGYFFIVPCLVGKDWNPFGSIWTVLIYSISYLSAYGMLRLGIACLYRRLRKFIASKECRGTRKGESMRTYIAFGVVVFAFVNGLFAGELNFNYESLKALAQQRVNKACVCLPGDEEFGKWFGRLSKYSADHEDAPRFVKEDVYAIIDGAYFMHGEDGVLIAKQGIFVSNDSSKKEHDGFANWSCLASAGYVHASGGFVYLYDEIAVYLGAYRDAVDSVEGYFKRLVAEARRQICVTNQLNVEFTSDGVTLTPLELAAALGDVSVAKELVAAGANVNLKDSGGCYPLRCAIGGSKYEMVDYLCSIGGTYFYDAPFYAVEKNNLKVIKLFVEKYGLSPNFYIQDDFILGLKMRGSLLGCAVYMKNIDIAKYLISKGGDVNYRIDTENNVVTPSPLWAAAIDGDLSMVRCLIETSGAKPSKDVIEAAKGSKVKEVLLYLQGCNGNYDSFYELGRMHYFGKGKLKTDYKEALKYFRLASDKGNIAGAANFLAWMYYTGKGTGVDYKEALKYGSLVVDKDGYRDSKYVVGVCLCDHFRSAENYIEGKKYLALAAKSGSKEAKKRLAELEHDEQQGRIYAGLPDSMKKLYGFLTKDYQRIGQIEDRHRGKDGKWRLDYSIQADYYKQIAVLENDEIPSEAFEAFTEFRTKFRHIRDIQRKIDEADRDRSDRVCFSWASVAGQALLAMVSDTLDSQAATIGNEVSQISMKSAQAEIDIQKVRRLLHAERGEALLEYEKMLHKLERRGVDVKKFRMRITCFLDQENE